ncbi:hypothetical protein GWD52_16805 [Enterobacteriaceae bacterium 4M9]|nr:hypothetical protein [Enterobacteriaceae bacterium 4M9]
MKEQPTTHPHRSRLSVVGKMTALLTGGLGIYYLVSEIWLWHLYRSDMVQGILSSFSDAIPRLLNVDFHLSTLAVALLFVCDALPVFMTALALMLIGLFFLRLSRNELWTRRNVRLLWVAGILNVLTPIVNSLSSTFQGLAISLDLPAGERLFQLTLGLSTDSLYEMVTGVVLCAFAYMIRESTKIHEENALYI